jgi:hypothetical protein
MPLSHKKLSAWYHLLAQQLDAGLPFPAALRASTGSGRSASSARTDLPRFAHPPISANVRTIPGVAEMPA